MEATENKAQPFGMLWLDAGLAASRKEKLQPLVFESQDHGRTVT